jgi:hypothetical protein
MSLHDIIPEDDIDRVLELQEDWCAQSIAFAHHYWHTPLTRALFIGNLSGCLDICVCLSSCSIAKLQSTNKLLAEFNPEYEDAQHELGAFVRLCVCALLSSRACGRRQRFSDKRPRQSL